MIPQDVDINSIRGELIADNVAINQIGREYPELEGQLIDVTHHAADSGFGKTGIVILDQTPASPISVRDIAQELLNTTDFSAIIVRTPHTGAVVSNNHSRAELESAQWHFLNTPDFVAGSRTLIDEVNVHTFPWAEINLAIAGLVLLAVIAVAFQAMAHRRSKISA